MKSIQHWRNIFCIQGNAKKIYLLFVILSLRTTDYFILQILSLLQMLLSLFISLACEGRHNKVIEKIYFDKYLFFHVEFEFYSF